jgi:RNA polymerase-binding transcription factor DksA
MVEKPAKKASAKASAAKKAPANKAAAKKAPVENKTSANKTSANKTSAKKAPAGKKTPAKKAQPKATPTKAAKKSAPVKAAKKSAAKKVATTKPEKKVAQVKPAKKAPEPKPVVVKEPKVTKAQLAAIAKAEAAAAAALAGPPVQVINPIGSVGLPSVRKAVPGKKAAPKHPVVQEDESNWSKAELNAVRKALTAEANELAIEITLAEEKFHALIMESGEGAGDDQADAGTKTFEREHEISILSNKKDLLDQTNRALDRIEAGTYGACETCGKQIGKLRLQEANPRATMCMPCRQREDRS